MNDSAIRLARGSELTAAQLYDILTLRVEVFVIEQECPYPELDGRDLPDSTIHLWYTEGGKPLAYLRILIEPEDGTARIGRVVTAKEHRGRGLSARLMERALAEIGHLDSVLDAQTYAQGFYTKFGYVAEGEPFDEDGIEHITMRRPAGRTG